MKPTRIYPKYLVCSDIHLGHLRTPTTHIADNFRKHILNKENQDLDILIIAGDLFERPLEANSPELLICVQLFNDILNFCYYHQIKLRLLNGTNTHDSLQLRIFVKLNEIRKDKYKVDLIYHEVLDIEYMEEFNLHFLYIPDNWTTDHDLLERQVNEKLKEHSISQVDISILHSCFYYQVANIPYDGFYLKEEYFLSITKDLIHIGHFHTHTHFDRIVAQGSFDRLRHNEEEPKGYVIVENKEWRFIENPDALIYKTIPVTRNTTINSLDKLIRQYPKESYIRLLLTSDHPFNLTFNELKVKYVDYILEKKVKSLDKSGMEIKDILSDSELSQLEAFSIDTDIKGLLDDIVKSKYTLTPLEQKFYTEYTKVFDNMETTAFE